MTQTMDLKDRIGLNADPLSDNRLIEYANIKLAYMGLPTAGASSSQFLEMGRALISRNQEAERLLANYLCPADQRIQSFLEAYTGDPAIRLPGKTFVLDQYGLARALSLPPGGNSFKCDIVSSYRVKQGVLHNPKSDRRTTEGIFHVTEGGLPIPDDKKAVPKSVFAEMLRRAFAPPADLLQLPFTAGQSHQAECFVSLLLRPLVCPAVPRISPERRMEVRFFVPGNLVGNLDFVESIFGNAGDPFLPENDAGLDVERWSGHTGCVILAPHLVKVTKKEVGLPHWDKATKCQQRDGMCWKKEDELYNNGIAFKLTARNESGVIVTLIADSYFGYCKKEVKCQISFAANLSAASEEEHAGGTLVYPSHDLGEEYSGDLHAPRQNYSFREVSELFAEIMEIQPEGYGIDKRYPDILYMPKDATFDLLAQRASWTHDGKHQEIKLQPGKTYMRPSGYKVHMEKLPGSHSWRLVGTQPEPTFCHKPCTVSGGGKSEISKPITDAIIQGPVFVSDFNKDFDQVEKLIHHDYGDRFIDPSWRDKQSRPLLSVERSLGSVIKLLTPASREYSAEYNDWLKSIPQHIKELAFTVKRYYKPEWGENWREHFSVDIINGRPANELRCDGRKVVASFLRVGYDHDGSWRTFGLRKDFHAAAKLSQEDDISVSVVVPTERLNGLNPDHVDTPAQKFVQNCEYRFFQRPDDAIVRGYDKLTEADFSHPGNFLSNYEPLPPEVAKELVEDSIGFDLYTAPMQQFIREVAETGQPAYFVSSAHPRIVDGKPTKNPRYLQTRPDLVHPRESYLAEIATRLHRKLPLDEPLYTPVNAILPGRRNNPPDPATALRPLCVYNPIHYMETPELFMEYIASMTGRSPSTTGAGSEGALTKGPFNAMPPIIDLNHAYIANLRTGAHGFVTAAGYVGPDLRVDHDVSLLVPEIWSRMTEEERDPAYLIKNGFLEKCNDLVVEGRTIRTSRLGYRITRRFVRAFFGRVFNHPQSVFTDEMLRPEKQDLAVIVDGMDNIVETHKRVAEHYFNDGSIEMACPPLKVLLHIMRDDQYEGKLLSDPKIRSLFTLESMLSSDWYAAHLKKRRDNEVRLCKRHIAYLEEFLAKASYAEEAERLSIPARLAQAKEWLKHVESKDYIAGL